MTHTSTMPPRNGTFSATLAGTRKIPEPITEPTTTQNASTGPKTRGNLTEGRSFVSSAAIRRPPDEELALVDGGVDEKLTSRFELHLSGGYRPTSIASRARSPAVLR